MSNPFYTKSTREIEGSIHSELEKERNEIDNAFKNVQQYADSQAEGLSWKQSVDVATDSAISDLTSPPSSIDGETVEEGDRVLVKDQGTTSENGIYTLDSSGELVRSDDFSNGDEVDGATVYVEGGNVNAEHRFAVIGADTTGDNEVIVDDDDINWTKISGTGQITAGSGLTKDSSNNSIDVNASDDSVNINSDDISVNVDSSTLAKGASGVFIADNGVNTTQLSSDAVTATELNSTAIGSGLTGGSGTSVSIASGGVTSTEINSSVAGKGLQGGGGTSLSVEERFSFETGIENLSDTTGSWTEKNRIALRTGEKLVVDRIEFREPNTNAENTNASVRVYDASASSLLSEVNLNTVTVNPGETNTGNHITVDYQSSIGSAVDATIRVIGRIVNTT